MSGRNVNNLRDTLLSVVSSIPEDLKNKEHRCRNSHYKKFSFNGKVESREEFEESYRNDITSLVCNILLVDAELRLSYYMDCFYSHDLVRYIRENIKILTFYSIADRSHHLVYRKENENVIKNIFNCSTNKTQFLGRVLDYSFQMSETEEDDNARHLASFKIEDSVLYSFVTDVPTKSCNTLISYNKLLRPLGYTVVLSITTL